jgi:hypothetical protein
MYFKPAATSVKTNVFVMHGETSLDFRIGFFTLLAAKYYKMLFFSPKSCINLFEQSSGFLRKTKKKNFLSTLLAMLFEVEKGA